MKSRWMVAVALAVAVPATARLPHRTFRSPDPRLRYGLDADWLRYDRVAGPMLGGWVGADDVGVAGSQNRLYLGYAASAGKLDAEASTRWPFSLGGAWEARAFWRDRLATDDDWKVGTFENTLAALLLREDLRDYFHVYGAGAGLEYWPLRTAGVDASFSYEGFRSVPREADFALFGRGKEFPDNPPVFDGWIGRAIVRVMYDNLEELVFLPDTEGWCASIAVERADSSLGSDVEYTRYLASVERLQETFGRQFFRARLLVGTASGSLPLDTASGFLPRQRAFVLGGVSTLRGHKERSFVGDRMVLLNFDYCDGGALVGRLRVPVLGSLQLFAFTDVGLAWPSERPSDEFDLSGFDEHTARVDVGFGLSDQFEVLRVNVARRTDSGEDAWRITGRVLIGEKLF